MVAVDVVGATGLDVDAKGLEPSKLKAGLFAMVVDADAGAPNEKGLPLILVLGGSAIVEVLGIAEENDGEIEVAIVESKILLESALGGAKVPRPAGTLNDVKGLSVEGLAAISSVAFVAKDELFGTLKIDGDAEVGGGMANTPGLLTSNSERDVGLRPLVSKVEDVNAAIERGAAENVTGMEVEDGVKLDVDAESVGDSVTGAVSFGAALLLLTMLRTSCATAESLGADSDDGVNSRAEETGATIGDSIAAISMIAFLAGISVSTSSAPRLSESGTILLASSKASRIFFRSSMARLRTTSGASGPFHSKNRLTLTWPGRSSQATPSYLLISR